MRSSIVLAVGSLGLAAAMTSPTTSAAQSVPVRYVTARGATVTPVYEGWYANPDGTVTLSWGFYNRNSEEALEIPHGPDNFIEPAELDGAQPTRLPPGRHWGTFGVVVPADYEGEAVRWTLRIRGGTFSIPANPTADWRIDARTGDAWGNTPPELAFGEGGPWFVGPGGASASDTVAVGEPLELTVWARDPDGSPGAGSESAPPLSATWHVHAGPAEVLLEPSLPEGLIEPSGGRMTATATFTEPGAYVVRARVAEGDDVRSAGHAQCCWSNGFFRITVTG